MNCIKIFFEEATAEVAFEDFRAKSPDEFKDWRANVVKNGPPKDLTDDACVGWGVYLQKLGLDEKYKVGHRPDALNYR